MSEHLTPTTSDELEQALIEDAAEGIDSVLVDGMSIRKSLLKDRMAVADRARNANAATKPHFGIRTTRLISPGGGGQ